MTEGRDLIFTKQNNEIAALKAEIQEYEDLSQLQHKRMVQAQKYWKEKTGAELVIADLGDLLKFLMDEIPKGKEK